MTRESASHTDRESVRPIRNVCETLLTLLIAVMIVKSFLVEGYLITTGSMAPHYYGQHKRAICPSCGTDFAVGTEFDHEFETGLPDWVFCPNCQRNDIELDDIPRNRGDHLLVWKNAYDFRDPRRWEVIVFRNPNSPRETFLKRVVALPGESIQIREGNVFVNGQLARKPLNVQQAMALVVFDQSHAPADDPEWTARWSAGSDQSGWSLAEGTWNFDPAHGNGAIEYRHTWRSGGEFETRVALDEPLTPAQREAFQPRNDVFPFSPEPPFPGVRYDESANELVARGVVNPHVYHELWKVDQTGSFTRAVEQLYRQSHFGPVLDAEAYNSYSRVEPEFAVNEFLLSCRIAPRDKAGRTTISLATPEDRFLLTLDFAERTTQLRAEASDKVLREGTWDWGDDAILQITLSSFDRQIAVSIDGVSPFEPYLLAAEAPTGEMSSVVASFEQTTVPLQVSDLKLFRDIYYTPGQETHGVKQPCLLGEGKFFVLGDNSAVSSDSRNWSEPAVPRKLIVGKPFLVHLPSRATSIRWGEKQIRFRIPDLDRVRFVR